MKKTANIEKIALWEDNPQKDRSCHVVRIDFNFPCTWTTFTIDELKEIIRLWIICEERRYPLEQGYQGRWMLFEEIKKIFNTHKGGTENMASLKEEALQYEAPQTKNIADLKEVSVDFALEDREAQDAQGVTFKYKIIVVNNEEYRVPNKVIGDLKAILEKKPDLEKFAVSRKGTGMQTQYTVIPLV